MRNGTPHADRNKPECTSVIKELINVGTFVSPGQIYK